MDEDGDIVMAENAEILNSPEPKRLDCLKTLDSEPEYRESAASSLSPGKPQQPDLPDWPKYEWHGDETYKSKLQVHMHFTDLVRKYRQAQSEFELAKNGLRDGLKRLRIFHAFHGVLGDRLINLVSDDVTEDLAMLADLDEAATERKELRELYQRREALARLLQLDDKMKQADLDEAVAERRESRKRQKALVRLCNFEVKLDLDDATNVRKARRRRQNKARLLRKKAKKREELKRKASELDEATGVDNEPQQQESDEPAAKMRKVKEEKPDDEDGEPEVI